MKILIRPDICLLQNEHFLNLFLILKAQPPHNACPHGSRTWSKGFNRQILQTGNESGGNSASVSSFSSALEKPNRTLFGGDSESEVGCVCCCADSTSFNLSWSLLEIVSASSQHKRVNSRQLSALKKKCTSIFYCFVDTKAYLYCKDCWRHGYDVL